MCETRNVYIILVAEPLVRPRRWEDNIKVELKKKSCEDSKVMELAQVHVQ
jgi:hypothetical protein